MSVPDPGAIVTSPAPEGIPVPSAGAAPPPASPSITSEPGAGDALLDSPLPDQPLFDRGYVRDLRERAASYRTQLREAQGRAGAYEVFDSYEPDDRQVWIALAQTWRDDPAEAARAMQQIATSVLGEGGSPPAPEPSTDTTTPPGELTPESIQQLIDARFAEQEQKRAEAAAVAQVHNEIRQAGYDPQSLEGMMVLHLAYSETEGDIKAAVAKLQARDQAAYDARIAAARNGHAPLAPTGGAVATSTPDTSGSWDETRRAAQRFLADSQAGSAGQA